MRDSILHPGDGSSHAVTNLLSSARGVAAEKIVTLFHPDMTYGSSLANRQRLPGAPVKLLFFGRILKYKGLDLLIEAVELLRAEGTHIQLGVAGTGNLARHRNRLTALGAEVINRWILDEEVGPLFARYEAVALSHIEASQSPPSPSATAFPPSACRSGASPNRWSRAKPASSRTAPTRALADAIHRMNADTELYERLSKNINATAEDRSMAHFANQLTASIGCSK